MDDAVDRLPFVSVCLTRSHTFCSALASWTARHLLVDIGTLAGFVFVTDPSTLA